MDLADMNKLRNHNYLYRYWLVIYVYSFVWVKPMNTYNKFVEILNKEHTEYGNCSPKLVQTDEGPEFSIIKKGGKIIDYFILTKEK